MKSRTKRSSAVAIYHPAQPTDVRKALINRNRSKSPLVKETLTPGRMAKKKTEVTPKKRVTPEPISLKGTLKKAIQNSQFDLKTRETEATEREQTLSQENSDLKEQLKSLQNTIGKIRKGQKEVNEERFMLMKDSEKKQRCYEALSHSYKGTINVFTDVIASLLDSPDLPETFTRCKRRLLEKLHATETAVGLNLQFEIQALASVGANSFSCLGKEVSLYERIDNLQSFCIDRREASDLTTDCSGRPVDFCSYSSIADQPVSWLSDHESFC